MLLDALLAATMDRIRGFNAFKVYPMAIPTINTKMLVRLKRSLGERIGNILVSS
jgi:hypothetical protein